MVGELSLQKSHELLIHEGGDFDSLAFYLKIQFKTQFSNIRKQQ